MAGVARLTELNRLHEREFGLMGKPQSLVKGGKCPESLGGQG